MKIHNIKSCPNSNINKNKNYQKNNYCKQNINCNDTFNLTKKTTFGSQKNVDDYIYEMSFLKHKNNISKIDPTVVEGYFNALGVPADFNQGSDFTRQFIAFCTFHTAEIFRQLNFSLPVKISIANFSDIFPENSCENAIGLCHYGPDVILGFPVRTVLFNSFETPQKKGFWENHFQNQKYNKEINFLSTKHFLSPFLHEFAHNLHFHKLYSKFGCPYINQGYQYSPNAQTVMKLLNLPIKDMNEKPVENPFISYEVRNALNTSSRYGSTLLPETFAEEFTRTVADNLNYMTLKLKRNPFPMAISNPTLQQVLYETWEGLIADGQGLI